MATFNKYNKFTEDLAEKVHNLGSDTLKVLLTTTAPEASNGAIPSDLATGGGYTSGGATTAQVTSIQTSGVYKLVLTDVVWTGTGSGFGPFRYVVLYNSTASNAPIGWYDYGSSISLGLGETFTVDFDGSAGVLTLT
jgi:hypothetical protein